MIIRRGLPIVLGVAGVSLLVYGAAVSRHNVLSEEEITPPSPPPEMPFFGPGPGGPDGPMPPPFIRPPPRPPARPIKVLRTITEREHKLIIEATRGGLIRMADGRLKRTYSGEPPKSGCPT